MEIYIIAIVTGLILIVGVYLLLGFKKVSAYIVEHEARFQRTNIIISLLAVLGIIFAVLSFAGQQKQFIADQQNQFAQAQTEEKTQAENESHYAEQLSEQKVLLDRMQQYEQQMFQSSVVPEVAISSDASRISTSSDSFYADKISSTTNVTFSIENNSPVALKNVGITLDLLYYINFNTSTVICPASQFQMTPTFSLLSLPPYSQKQFILPFSVFEKTFSEATALSHGGQNAEYLRFTVTSQKSVNEEYFSPPPTLFSFLSYSDTFIFADVKNDTFASWLNINGMVPLISTSLYNKLLNYDARTEPDACMRPF